MRLRKRQGPYEIAVFTAPNPLVAGPVDISVLVLDLASGEPVLDASVSVKVAPAGRPEAAVSHPATTEAATNKLLYAAVFELPESGIRICEVDVSGVHGKVEVRFTLDVASAGSRWIVLWPWICWPAPVILLYGIHQRSVWRKTRSRTLAPNRL